MSNFSIKKNSDKSIYIQLKGAIKEAVISGKYPPLSKLPPVSQIAAEAGVSIRTADIALKELINEGICFRRPKKGTFVSEIPPGVCQKTFGIITSISAMSSSVNSLLYCGVMEATIKRNIPVFTIPVPFTQNSSAPADVINMFDHGINFDMQGVFIASQCYNREVLETARLFPSKRFFYLNYQGDWLHNMPENTAAVVNDDFMGAYNLAQRVFAEYKVKNAAVLSIPLQHGDMTYEERTNGIKAAALKNNIPVVSEIIARSRFSHYSGQVNAAYEAMKEFFSKGGKTDFVFCTNDLLASGVKNAIEENNMQDKIHVSGYDCFYDQYISGIPSVKVAYTEMGKVALEQMLSPDMPSPGVIKLLPETVNI